MKKEASVVPILKSHLCDGKVSHEYLVGQVKPDSESLKYLSFGFRIGRQVGQSRCCWYGFGIRCLLDAIGQRRIRAPSSDGCIDEVSVTGRTSLSSADNTNGGGA